MSIILDHVRAIDKQLNGIQYRDLQQSDDHSESLGSESASLRSSDDDTLEPQHGTALEEKKTAQAYHKHLESIIDALSLVTSSKQLVSVATLLRSLQQAGLSQAGHVDDKSEVHRPDTEALQWALIGKVTIQAYGIILNILLDRMMPYTDDIAYWNDIISSPYTIGLHAIQIAPFRLYNLSQKVFNDARAQWSSDIRSFGVERSNANNNLLRPSSWPYFYDIVRQSIRRRNLHRIQSSIMLPYTQCQQGIQTKIQKLVKLREMSAAGLGILMDEGLVFHGAEDSDSVSSKGSSSARDGEWRMVVSKTITLLSAVLQNTVALNLKSGDMEETVFSRVDEEAMAMQGEELTPRQLSRRLHELLNHHIPGFVSKSDRLLGEYSRPSWIVRYWIPVVALFFSSSSILRFVVNRKAAIWEWISDLGQTSLDFWRNWVLSPVQKIISTIRHDKDSEIALMSKESLQGDRESLQRMVVDFVVDNTSGPALSEADLVEVRGKVQAGDLTPVLKAYERDLHRPFMGTLRGDLIRTLLIQVQKTKVDIEVAMGGIDNLLKSQELVFGFVSVTPGILVTFAVSRWFVNMITTRRSRVSQARSGLLRPLRNADRILCGAKPSPQGMLSYKEHGLLLCEVHVLRQRAQAVLPVSAFKEFLEDIHDLIDLRTGIERQLRVIERIRWAFPQWST